MGPGDDLMNAASGSEPVGSSAASPREAPLALEITRAYHERSKHHPTRLAPALGYLDWAKQPDPFRRFEGAPIVPLDLADRKSVV